MFQTITAVKGVVVDFDIPGPDFNFFKLPALIKSIRRNLGHPGRQDNRAQAAAHKCVRQDGIQPLRQDQLLQGVQPSNAKPIMCVTEAGIPILRISV